jgi:hypothetical protein
MLGFITRSLGSIFDYPLLWLEVCHDYSYIDRPKAIFDLFLTRTLASSCVLTCLEDLS